MIIPLDTKNKTTASEVGGKGYSLIKLTQAGFNVPPGFIIPSSHFEDHEFLKNNLEQAFEEYSYPSYAVRSSGTLEDSDRYSFAGQFETYLDISSKDVSNNVEKCWESAGSKRVTDYCRAQRIDDTQLKLAVIIQKYIDADVSGICFTNNPVDNNPNMMLIETAEGTGEKIVQGEVSPRRLGVVRDRFETKGESLIPLKLHADVFQTFVKIEETFGAPQDIEFSLFRNELFILQSRPITTLN